MNLKRVWASDGTPAENPSSDGYRAVSGWSLGQLIIKTM